MGWKDTIKPAGGGGWRDTITDEPVERPWYDVSAEGLVEGFKQAPQNVIKGFEVLDEHTGAPVRQAVTETLTGQELDKAPTGKEQAQMLMKKYGLPDESSGPGFNTGVAPSDILGLGLEVVQDPLSFVSGAAKGVSKLAKPLEGMAAKAAKGLETFSNRQGARAVGLERGTAKKIGDKRVQEIGAQARDKSVFGMFTDTDEKIARNQALKDMAAGERNAVYKTIDDAGASQFSPADAMYRVDEKLGNFNKQSPLNAPIKGQLDNTIEAIWQRVQSGQETIPMAEAQELLKELKSAAKWPGIGVKTPKEEMAEAAYNEVRRAVNDAAEKSAELVGLSGLKETLQRTNKTYSIGKDTDKLLNNEYARDMGNKTFGLTDWIAGAGAAATGNVTPAVAGTVATKKISEKYGSQVASIGAHKLADIVEKTPQALGKYAPILQQASQRGANALGVTDFILQQQDPEYRKLKKQLDGTE